MDDLSLKEENKNENEVYWNKVTRSDVIPLPALHRTSAQCATPYVRISTPQKPSPLIGCDQIALNAAYHLGFRLPCCMMGRIDR
jgi:hypothetical protein